MFWNLATTTLFFTTVVGSNRKGLGSPNHTVYTYVFSRSPITVLWLHDYSHDSLKTLQWILCSCHLSCCTVIFLWKKMTSIVAPITVLWLQYYSYELLINLQQIIDVLIYSLISSIWMNSNIRTVQSESSTFASLSFDLGVPKKRPTTAPSDSILHRSNCCLFR